MNGIDIVRLLYQNLRTPSDTMLPPRFAFDKIREVVRKKKLDLSLVEQNAEAKVSEWFNVSGNDFEIDIDDILLPLRVEIRDGGGFGGREIPLVSYNVLNDAPFYAASFYGNPLRIAFRGDYANREIRIIYEPDFSDEVDAESSFALPEFFTDMVASEAAYLLIMLIPDNSPEYMTFAQSYMPILQTNVADWRVKWEKYVKRFRGQAKVPKKTFLQNRRRGFRLVNDGLDNFYLN